MRFGSPKESDASVEAIEHVYRLRYFAFLKVAASVAGEGQAGDAVHAGFVRALRHRDSFRGESSLETWLWRLVVNAARDLRSGERTRDTESDDALVESGDDPTAESALVRRAIARLPARQRIAVFLRYYADLDYQAIAVVLGVERGTVSATLHSAHETIRQQIEEARCKIF